MNSRVKRGVLLKNFQGTLLLSCVVDLPLFFTNISYQVGISGTALQLE